MNEYSSQTGVGVFQPSVFRIGELEYEVRAALRNPIERPDLFARPRTIQRRVEHFATALDLSAGRVLRWAFAQAILAAIWEVEGMGVLRTVAGFVAFANAIHPMLGRAGG